MPQGKISILGAPQAFGAFFEQLFRQMYEIEQLSLFNEESCQKAQSARVIFLFHKPPALDALQSLLVLRGRVTAPVVVVFLNPCAELVQTAYRRGASDVLLHPGEREQVLECFYRNYHAAKNISNSGWDRVTNWFANVMGSKPKPGFMPAQLNAGIPPAPAETPPDIEANLFGHFSLRIRGIPVSDLPHRKVLELLAHLLLHSDKPLHRDSLLGIFWPDYPQESAKNSLNVAIHALRCFLQPFLPGCSIITFTHGCYSVSTELTVRTDTGAFQNCLHTAADFLHRGEIAGTMSALHQALHVYRGDFLANFRAEEWIEDNRNHLREKYLQALNMMSDYFFRKKDYYLTINMCNQMLDTDPSLEPIHRRLMECYFATGERNLALRQFQKCGQMMEKVFETTPSPKTIELYRKVIDGSAAEIQYAPESAQRIAFGLL